LTKMTVFPEIIPFLFYMSTLRPLKTADRVLPSLTGPRTTPIFLHVPCVPDFFHPPPPSPLFENRRLGFDLRRPLGEWPPQLIWSVPEVVDLYPSLFSARSRATSNLFPVFWYRCFHHPVNLDTPAFVFTLPTPHFRLDCFSPRSHPSPVQWGTASLPRTFLRSFFSCGEEFPTTWSQSPQPGT